MDDPSQRIVMAAFKGESIVAISDKPPARSWADFAKTMAEWERKKHDAREMTAHDACELMKAQMEPSK